MIQRVLVVGLGNPKPYLETLHSAGNMVLDSLQTLLPGQPSFSKQRLGKEQALASIGSRFVLVQSPTYMNVTGPWLQKVYKEIARETPAEQLGLLVVHDDLETALGEVKLRPWKASHKGHNGLKSIQKSMNNPEFTSTNWAKLSVGIGRPEERTSDVISRYVLRSLVQSERQALRNVAPTQVMSKLYEIESKWTTAKA